MADKYKDLDKIRDDYERARTRAQAERHHHERDWFRNVLFYIGIQWIIYSPQTRKWVQRQLKKFVPRPVTNKFAMHANTMIQMLRAKPPEATVMPATDDADDIATAEIANRNMEVIYDEADADFAHTMSAAWRVLTGQAILHPCYDKDPRWGTVFLQGMICNACGEEFGAEEGDVCPKCQSPDLAPSFDAKGKPKGKEAPKGRLKIEVFSPFETYMDLEARSLDELDEILIRRRYPINKARGIWPLKDGTELQPDRPDNQAGSLGMTLLRAIAFAAGTGVQTGYGGGRGGPDDQGVTVDFLWKRPCDDYPEGLVAIFANDRLLNEDDLSIPYHDEQGKPLWPWYICPFDRVPGRILGRTKLDDLAPLQEERNRTESLLRLAITRMANAVWLIPKGSGIDFISGEPGEILRYNAVDPRMKPDRMAGEQPPPVLVQRIAQLDADMEQIAGTFDVLKGSAPTGITAGTALRLLLERAVTQFTPALEEFEQTWAKISKDLLNIAREYWTEERINRNAGQGKSWEVEKFSRAQLTGGVDVIVEAGSSVPKNSVATQALIQDLQAMQVINPTDPETQMNILKQFGMSSLIGSADDNMNQAERETWEFQAQGVVPVLNPIVDSHIAHILSHKRFALSGDFKKLDPTAQAIWMQHIAEHQMAMMPPPMLAPPQEGPPEKGKEIPKKSEGQEPNMVQQDSQMPPPMPGVM